MTDAKKKNVNEIRISVRIDGGDLPDVIVEIDRHLDFRFSYGASKIDMIDRAIMEARRILITDLQKRSLLQ